MSLSTNSSSMLSVHTSQQHYNIDWTLFLVRPGRHTRQKISCNRSLKARTMKYPTVQLLVAAFFATATTLSARTTTAFVSPSAVKHQRPTTTVAAVSSNNNSSEEDNVTKKVTLASILSFGLAVSMMAGIPGPAFADGQTEKFKLPPIDKTDKTRCTLNSSTIGQANAARDKLYDLRECKLSGSSAVGFDLSGVIMTNTDVSKVNFQDAMFSKGYLQGT